MGDAQDTIFAKASGAGQAAVAVLRLSGPGAGPALAQLAGRLPAPRHASLRRLRCPRSQEVLDQALVLWFPGPQSYTGEDSAELHLHGGAAVVAGVAEALAGLGCRPAEPGEFTRRAFLHGKLDLTQAEAVADLIAAETAAQRRQALRQAEGALATLYGAWTARATRILAHQEAAIEFEMDDLPSDLSAQARREAATLGQEIAAHLDDGNRGERLREGLSIAILGAPNAGKSSLLNALVGRDAAIVSTQAGTTRDVVEVRLDLGGIPAILADTAGLRATQDEIEQEGVRRARRRAEEADLVLAVFAADAAPDTETLALAGFEAQSDAVELSLGRLVAEGFRPETVLEDLGTRWEITRNWFRLRACCNPIHSALDALQEALARLRPDPASIERIDIRTYQFAAKMGECDPANYFASRYSLPHAAAGLALCGSTGFDTLNDDTVHDPAWAAMRQRVHVSEDMAMTAALPHRKPSLATVTLKDGRSASGTCDLPRGDFQNPYDESEIRAKFHGLAAHVLSADGARRAEAAVDAVEDWEDVAGFVKLLRQASR